MNFAKSILPLSILIIFLVSCNNNYLSSPSISNPTPKDYLKNEDADIFLLDGYVFSNAEDVEWVTELEYELGGQVGEISKQADKASKFKNGTANKLPIGTKIFETNTPAYIAIIGEKEIPYLKMVEG
ncbi:hypothetical protein M3204_23515 [Mesobacillus subterraneus]|uniref:hypothetical protein n=1 Tax=Mesobacillus subterraneus TaxID=285983 RepID=UPI00203F02E8|nr:hypothetical protein [Mesobacillus subterraneus]MCM3667347.1 hypothetical protein [Mesobacillus subterraneus]MCM3686331.1 hypothetical protein [Mesobacillus subterraneus]